MDDRKSKISQLSSRSSSKAMAKSRLTRKKTSLSSLRESWKLLFSIILIIGGWLAWKPFVSVLGVFETKLMVKTDILFKQIGFHVNELVVEGRSLTLQKDILKAANIKRGDSLFSPDLKVIKEHLEKLSWVRTATVQRRWPFTIYIRLAEYKPIALWQQKSKFYLVDDQGHHFTIPKDNPFRSLPIITGEEAPQNAPFLFSTLREFPNLIGRITGAIYLGKRRWDLMLDNRLKLKLAEGKIKQSLTQFAQLEESNKISDKNVVAIDLRFEDKVYFQLAPEAADVKLSSKQT